MNIELILSSLLAPAVVAVWLQGRANISKLEEKISYLMKREEVIEHVDKQINHVKELMERDKEHMEQILTIMHEDIKEIKNKLGCSR